MTFCSLIVPCLNEARNVPLILERAQAAFADGDSELIIVDNGSTDDTAAVLDDLLPKYPFARRVRVAQNRGYGYGILAGLQAAHGRVLAWTHADMQTDLGDAQRGLAFFREAADPDRLFVKGRRQGRPIGDRIFTAGMGALETLLFRAPLWDINAQPTMFGRGFFASWSDPPWDFSLDLYAYARARKQKLTVRRFAVVFAARAHGSSHWNIDWRSKIKFIRRTLGYSFKLAGKLK